MLWQLFDPQPSRVWQQGQTRLGQNFVRCSSMRIFNVFRPQTGAISAFLTTLRLEMMMIEICMVTITLQLCVIINMKTKYCVLIFEQICPQNLFIVRQPGLWRSSHMSPVWGFPIWRILHPWNMGEIHALVNGGGCWGVDVLVFCAGWVGHKGGYWVGGTRDLLRVCASHWIWLYQCVQYCTILCSLYGVYVTNS